MSSVVIVGASIGGVRAAQSLRSEGFSGSITLVGADEDLPYDKPPLTKGLLAGTDDEDGICLLTQAQANEANIELRLGSPACSLSAVDRQVQLEGGENLHYDTLVVATGARARPSPWDKQPGVHVVRTLRDAHSLRSDLSRGGHVVVIGAGFIGAEVASTARELGLAVTIIDPSPTPMARAMDTETGRWFTDLYEQNGVRCEFGIGVTSVSGVLGAVNVELSNGKTLAADVVVVGIGAIPNDRWLESSGLKIDDGIVCDEYCRALEFPEIFAVGDVARWLHCGDGTLKRVEHWTNAVEQAACVAHNIVNPDRMTIYEPIEYVWSNQHGRKIQIVGSTGGDTPRTTIRRAGHDEQFAVLYHRPDQTLAGAIAVDWPRAMMTCRKSLALSTSLDEVYGILLGL